ncbi:MAG: hypothetical protein ABI596_15925 [Pyrinomonadaceae bacterium]
MSFANSEIRNPKSPILLLALALAIAAISSYYPASALGQKRRPARRASICGNPQLACKTSVTFEPYQIQFRVPKNAAIFDTELFYAIVLKSVSAGLDDCDVFVSENERLAAQVLFPDHKVFTSRCFEPGDLFYTNIGEKHRIMAVYAGTTPAEAKRFLQTVKATGKFPDAYIRRMRTGFNGT